MAQVLARGLSLVAAVASTAIVTRAVGVTTYADWGTALTVIAMVGFVLDPGVGPIVVRRLIQAPATAPSVRAMLAVRLAIAAVAVLVVVVIVVAVRGTGAALLATVLAAQLLPRTVILNGATLLQVDHLQHRQAFLEVGTALVGVAAIAVAAALSAPVAVLALVGVTVPLALQTVPVSRWAARTHAHARIVAGDDRARLTSIAREIAPLAVALLLVAVYTRIQVVFVNVAEDTAGVARYLLAFQVVEQLFTLGGIVAATLMPFIADRARDGDVHGDDLTQTVLVAALALGTVVAAGLLLLAEPVMALLGGPELAGASADLVLLSPMAVAVFPGMLLSFTYAAMGLGRRYLVYNAIGLAVALAANATVTLHAGAAGAARVSYGVEFLVVATASIAIARSGGPGQRLLATMLLAMVAGAGCAEAVAAGVAPGLAAAVLALAGLALGGPAAWTLVRTRLLGGAAA